MAASLQMPFYDLDRAVESKLGKPVERVIAEEGEVFYRMVEAEVLREICLLPFAVVALGAGTVTYPESRKVIQERGVLIWLKAGVEELWRRTEGEERWVRLWNPSAQSQPLPGAEVLRQRLVELLEIREPFYRIADISVDTTGLAVDEVVQEILRRLRDAEWQMGPG